VFLLLLLEVGDGDGQFLAFQEETVAPASQFVPFCQQRVPLSEQAVPLLLKRVLLCGYLVVFALDILQVGLQPQYL
jgi:hypothetical protein